MREEERSQNGTGGLEADGTPGEGRPAEEGGSRAEAGKGGTPDEGSPAEGTVGGTREGGWRKPTRGGRRRDGVIPNPKAKVLDQVREVMRVGHYSIRTERCYCDWIRRYILFHRLKLREELFSGEDKVELFLSDLAVNRHVAAATQNQAFNALLFLYPDDPGVAGSRGCLDDDD